jgi:hypothetical protein
MIVFDMMIVAVSFTPGIFRTLLKHIRENKLLVNWIIVNVFTPKMD